jgi:ketosteroid isomerase-like protein
MSQENVEMVGRFMDAIERAFSAYWQDPRSIATALEANDLWPEWAEAFEYVHPEIEWRTTFLGGTHHGQLEAARVWDDFLKWAADYRPTLEAVDDLGGDQVYVVVGLAGKDKESDFPVQARFFDVFTVRGGLIVRIEEYTSRAEALEAVGLRE